MHFVNRWHRVCSWQVRYGVAIGTVLASLSLHLLVPIVSLAGPFLLFAPAVVISAWYGGAESGLAATGLSCLCAAYFLLEPAHSLLVDAPTDVVRLGLFAGVGIQISWLSGSLLMAKRRAEAQTRQVMATALALEQSEERYHQLVQQIKDYAIYALDLDGYVVSWNEGAERLKGFKAQEILGQHFSRFYLPADREQQMPQLSLNQAVQAGRFEGEGWRVRKDGSLIWVNVVITPLRDRNGNLYGFSKVARDMTERKQAELQLQALNNSLEQQVRDRTAQLFQTLSFEATLKRITDKVRDSLDESNILQTAVQELGDGLGVRCCNAALYNLEEGTSTVYYEHNNSIFSIKGRVSRMANYPELYQPLLQGNYLQFCNTIANPIRGRVTMLACPIRDDQGTLGDLWLVTDKEYVFRESEVRLVEQVANQCAIALRQARLYEAAQAQVKMLEQLNWLKDDFLSTVSHELRTPVSNMKLSIRMLEIALNHGDSLNGAKQKVDQYLQILRTECDREITLINDLLDLQRLESGKRALNLEKIQLNTWIDQVVRPFRERAQARQQTLVVELPDQGLPPLKSDAPALERILAELLNNACKYTPPGETITVILCPQPNTMQFQVRNSGVEIPVEEQRRIFDKFYRVVDADRWKQGGTGLGLALVQRLAEHMGGTVQVESVSGQTTFIVEVPNQTNQTQEVSLEAPTS